MDDQENTTVIGWDEMVEDNERLRHLLAEAWGWVGVKPASSVKPRVDDLLARIEAEIGELL